MSIHNLTTQSGVLRVSTAWLHPYNFRDAGMALSIGMNLTTSLNKGQHLRKMHKQTFLYNLQRTNIVLKLHSRAVILY